MKMTQEKNRNEFSKETENYENEYDVINEKDKKLEDFTDFKLSADLKTMFFLSMVYYFMIIANKKKQSEELDLSDDIGMAIFTSFFTYGLVEISSKAVNKTIRKGIGLYDKFIDKRESKKIEKMTKRMSKCYEDENTETVDI